VEQKQYEGTEYYNSSQFMFYDTITPPPTPVAPYHYVFNFTWKPCWDFFSENGGCRKSGRGCITNEKRIL